MQGSTKAKGGESHIPNPGEGGNFLIWPIRVCAAEKGLVFKVLSIRLLSVLKMVSFFKLEAF